MEPLRSELGTAAADKGGALNPSPIDTHKDQTGANCPASGEELASGAEKSNDACGGLFEWLRSFGEQDFSGPAQVMSALER